MGASTSIDVAINTYEKSFASVADHPVIKWHIGLVINLIGYGLLQVYQITPSNNPPGSLCITHDNYERVFIYHYSGNKVILPHEMLSPTGVYAMHLKKVGGSNTPTATMLKFTRDMVTNVVPTIIAHGVNGGGENKLNLQDPLSDDRSEYDRRVTNIVGAALDDGILDENGINEIINDAIAIRGGDGYTDDELINEIRYNQHNLTVDRVVGKYGNYDDPSNDNIADITKYEHTNYVINT